MLIGIICSTTFSAWNFSNTSESTTSNALELSASRQDLLRLLLIFSLSSSSSISTLSSPSGNPSSTLSSSNSSSSWYNHLFSIYAPISFLEGAKTDSSLGHASRYQPSSMHLDLNFIMILVTNEEMKLAYSMVACCSWNCLCIFFTWISITSSSNWRGTLIGGVGGGSTKSITLKPVIFDSGKILFYKWIKNWNPDQTNHLRRLL